MKNSGLKILIYAFIFGLVLIGHSLLMRFGLQSKEDFRTIYIFVFSLNLIALIVVAVSNFFWHQHLGFIFMGIVLLKLVVAKIFMNHYEQIEQTEHKISFLILYLISIVFITIFTSRLLLFPEK